MNYQNVTVAGQSMPFYMQGGYINGPNNMFNSGGYLMINNNQFQPTSAQRSSTGDEFKMENANCNGLAVSRWIRINGPRGYICWLDQLTNNGGNGAAQVQVSFLSGFNYASNMLQTDKGRSVINNNGGTSNSGGIAAAKNEAAVFSWFSNNIQSSALFYFGDGTAKVRPAISADTQRMYLNYALTIPPGKTVTLVHAIAFQTPSLPQGDAKKMAEAIKALQIRPFLQAVPAKVLNTVVNMASGSYTIDLVAGQMTDWSNLGVERDKVDLLVFAAGQFRGNASWRRLAIEGRFGRAELKPADVAALVGPCAGQGGLGGTGAGTGTGTDSSSPTLARVLLRDGQVLVGKLDVDGLRFDSDNGLTVNMEVKTLDRLVMRQAPEDGRPGSDVIAFVDTLDGQRLAVRKLESSPLTLVSGWGRVTVPLDQVRCLMPPTAEKLLMKVQLADGTRIDALLDKATITIDSRLFGVQQLATHQVQAIWSTSLKAAQAKDPSAATGAAPAAAGATGGPGGITAGAAGPPDPELAAMTFPHVVLRDENVLVGQLQAENIHLVGPADLEISPRQIRQLVRADDDESVAPGTFRVELWNGDSVSGMLRETELTIAGGGGSQNKWVVPAGDILAVVMPTPTLPSASRKHVAELVKQLGEEDWSKRESAQAELERMGPASKALLYEALKSATDPEVRKRLSQLLE